MNDGESPHGDSLHGDSLHRELLGSAPFTRAAAPWSVVSVEGRDALDFLQRLCSQDVVGLPPGSSRPGAFLDPKGKLQLTCRVVRAGDRVLLEVRTELQDRLLQLLERYHFTEQLQFAAQTGWTCSEWIGATLPAGLAADQAVVSDDGLVLAVQRHGVATVHAYGTAPAPASAQPLAEDHAEALYMLQGLVRTGADTEPRTLVLEAGLEDHCSTTKGCYTGQEIVARIHTYGHTNRRLCLLRLEGAAPIAAPVELQEPEDGVAVGRVMRAVPLPSGRQRLGVGYLPQDFQQPGQRLRLAGDGSGVEVLRA